MHQRIAGQHWQDRQNGDRCIGLDKTAQGHRVADSQLCLGGHVAIGLGPQTVTDRAANERQVAQIAPGQWPRKTGQRAVPRKPDLIRIIKKGFKKQSQAVRRLFGNAEIDGLIGHFFCNRGVVLVEPVKCDVGAFDGKTTDDGRQQ